MLLVLDNYDSFTYNLVQYLGELGATPTVYRNDAITLAEVEALAPTAIVVSPGPGAPAAAGISNALIRAFAGRVPILGVCLGHQAIGEVFGGVVARARVPVHGKTSWVHHDGRGVFAGLANPFEATRYHSLVVRRDGLPDCLEVSAWTDDGLIMGLRHRDAAVEGVQFHPESILTGAGKALLANFIGPAQSLFLTFPIDKCPFSPAMAPQEPLGGPAGAPGRCPVCRTKILVSDEDGLVVRNAILKVNRRTGHATAKCPRCKAWVEVPLKYEA